jgi:hypothetical protein
LQKNTNKNNNNKLEMEKGKEKTLDESSIIRQELVLLKVEKTVTQHHKEKEKEKERKSLQALGWKIAN